ncbi:MAG: hypothetical protein GY861_12920 [bacterium]|nr:hypothetical protein [bacterium]
MALVTAISVLVIVVRLFRGTDLPPQEIYPFIYWSSSKQNTTFLQRAKFILISTLTLISLPFSWPGQLVISLLGMTRKVPKGVYRVAAYDTLFSNNLLTPAPLVACLALVIGIHTWFNLPHIPANGFSIIMIIFATATLIIGLLDQSVAMRARRQIGNPYLRFILFTVSIYGILVLSYSVLYQDSPRLSITALTDVTVDILRIQGIGDLFQDDDSSFAQYSAGLTGILFYASLVSSVYRFREFRRTDDDYIAIAESYMHMGHFNSAMSSLRKVRTQTPDFFVLKSICYLALNQMDKALKTKEQSIIISEYKGYASDDPALLLFFTTQFFPIGSSRIVNLFSRWIEGKPSELRVLGLVDKLILANKVSPDEVIDVIENAGMSDDYSLIIALCLIGADDRENAAIILQNLSLDNESSELHQIILGILVLSTQIDVLSITEDNTSSLLNWSHTYMQKISSFVHSSPSVEDTFCLLNTLAIPYFIAQQLDQDTAEDIRFLMDELEEIVKSTSFSQAALSVTQNLRKFSFRTWEQGSYSNGLGAN